MSITFRAEKRAAEIPFGLSFDKEMQAKRRKDFSGKWRMRIALARALFIMPTIILLDDPTIFLDLEACVWLEESLKNFDRNFVVVSHSQDFLNGVETKQMVMATGSRGPMAITDVQDLVTPLLLTELINLWTMHHVWPLLRRCEFEANELDWF